VPVATRVLPLEGGRNFRDLGGYSAEDGRSVRWGLLFRSGAMTQLTPSDYEYLAPLGIRVICDFRTTGEREDEPTIWQAEPAPRFMNWDGVIPYDELPLNAALRSQNATQEMIHEAMAGLYRAIPYVYSDRYRDLFLVLGSGEAPLAFHCSAGKDRAGIAAALLLTALGVPRETVIDDYALSDTVVDWTSTSSDSGSREQVMCGASGNGQCAGGTPAPCRFALCATPSQASFNACHGEDRGGAGWCGRLGCSC